MSAVEFADVTLARYVIALEGYPVAAEATEFTADGLINAVVKLTRISQREETITSNPDSR